ncbi:glycosyltransferase [Atopobium sp. oral taxon 810]|uniref:glycosyltransferase n=1 Tax=Atopobium sp. oral taxon 810 TaxID=712158 RepID=UPI0012ECB2D7|nr:glycosyltransferase [Atopobium sp. oral taxon 810]
MKKVLMVSCEGLGNGGVQAVMMGIVRGLKSHCHFDMLLFTSERRYYDDEFESYGNIFRIPHYEGSNPFLIYSDYYLRGQHLYKRVKEILKEHGPYEVIHCNNDFEGALCLKAAAEAGVPIRIIQAHVELSLANENILRRHIDLKRRNLICQYATTLIGCSTKACSSLYGPDAPFIIIPNAYDAQRFNKNLYSLHNDRLTLIQIGRFIENKNQLFSVSVLRHIQEYIADAQLNLVGFGDDSELSRLHHAIEEAGLTNFVHLYPSDANTPELLSGSSALLLPSRHEGFGIVLVEAQAMGVRCYVSDTVPRDANVGGCSYLPLQDGAAIWARRIVNDYSQGLCKHHDYDCTQFKSTTVIKKIRDIYFPYQH